MTNQPEHTVESRLSELFNSFKPTPAESTKEKRTYHIEVDDDTHWALVSIAAKQKLHQEDYVENLLVEFVVEHHAAMTLRKSIEIDKTIENNIQPISFDDRLPGDEDVENGCCWLWHKKGEYWNLDYVRTQIKANLSSCYTCWLPYSAIVFPEATS